MIFVAENEHCQNTPIFKTLKCFGSCMLIVIYDPLLQMVPWLYVSLTPEFERKKVFKLKGVVYTCLHTVKVFG